MAVKRAYLRNAGMETGAARKADHDPSVRDEEALRRMQFCALTDQPLDFESGVVVCPYGKLFNKEAAVEALLRRKQDSSAGGPQLGGHIRGLKDLHSVRFQTTKQDDGSTLLVCPVTGRELNGRIPTFALIPGNESSVNVVSEYALHQLGETEILTEYGARKKIRIAPPPDALKEIKAALEEERVSSKRKKKRKRVENKSQNNH